MLISNKRKQRRESTTSSNIKGGFYFHTEEDFELKRESDIKIINQNGSIEISKYNEIVGPFYWDVDDFVSGETRKRILSNRKGKHSIIVGVPTYKSEDYIYNYITGDKEKRDLFNQLKVIKEAHPDWNIELVVNLTVDNNSDNTEQVIKKIQKEALQSFPSIRITLITMPFRTKVNAMNAIAEYAKKKKATILCFVDDDTLHYPNNALLSNIETLLSKDTLSIIAPRYDPGPPKSIWERMRSIRWRYHINKTVPGESMVMDVESYPKIPYYLNSDDLYLTSYFLDVNYADPSKRVSVNKNSVALSGLAGNSIIDGLKVLRRSSYGINQLFSFMPQKKRKSMSKLIRGEPFFSTLNLIKSKGSTLDAFLLIFSRVLTNPMILIIKTELIMRQSFGRPKKTITYDRDFSALTSSN